MHNCAIIHPLHLELETAPFLGVPFRPGDCLRTRRVSRTDASCLPSESISFGQFSNARFKSAVRSSPLGISSALRINA